MAKETVAVGPKTASVEAVKVFEATIQALSQLDHEEQSRVVRAVAVFFGIYVPS